MNAQSLYHDLKGRGVILEAQVKHLKVDAPAGVLTDKHRTALKEFKPKLLNFLPRPQEESEPIPERESVARWAGAHKDTRPVHGRVARVAGG
jgi:TubC N-terminal docking domain